MTNTMQVDISNFTHADWLKERRKAIGGSDVAAILGISKWKSPMDVYLEKISTAEPDETENEACHWGTLLEDVIRNEYSRRHGVGVEKPKAIFYDRERPYMAANLDGIVQCDKPYIWEGKTANHFMAKEWEDDNVPIEYVVQEQHYLSILEEMKKSEISCLLGGQNYIERVLPRDSELIRTIRDKEEKFWQMVIDRTPPEWDGSESAGKILKTLYPTSTEGKVVELGECGEDVHNAFRTYLDMKQMIDDNKNIMKDVNTRLEQAKQVIQAAIGDGEVGLIVIDGKDYKVNAKTINKKEHVVKASSYRQFLVKEIGA